MSRLLLSEDLLKESVIRACERENTMLGMLAAEEEEPAFSREFEKSMQRLCKEEKKGKRENVISYSPARISKKRLRVKIILIAALVAMLGSMTVLAVGPVREKLYKMVETLFPDHTDVNFQEIGEETAGDETDSEDLSFNPADFPRKLKWMPEGFVLESEEYLSDNFYMMQMYCNQQNEYEGITYTQVPVDGTGMSITSDGTPAEEITVGGERAYLFTDEDDYHNIVLTKEGFIYHVSGNIEVKTMVRCLESVF